MVNIPLQCCISIRGKAPGLTPEDPKVIRESPNRPRKNLFQGSGEEVVEFRILEKQSQCPLSH